MKKIMGVFLFIFAAGVFAELPISVTRFRKAPVEVVLQYAQQKDAEAQLELALRYHAGYQVEQNEREAFSWMTRAAELENPDARFLLSRMYAEGLGTAPDTDKAEHIFVRALAAQPDDAQLQAQYAVYLEQKKASPKELDKFIMRCADAGYSPAYIAVYHAVATNLYAEKRYEEVVPVFEQLAEKGDSEAGYYLAGMYAKGLGGLQEDHVEAFELYERAASNNYAEAQYALAVMYEKGRGVLEDEDKAVFWYEKAARNGHAEAQYRIARFEFDKAVFWQEESERQESKQEGAREEQRKEDVGKYRQRLASAVGWYKKAAEQGQRDAQYHLGRLYASGEGVVQDFPEAVRFYELSAAQGHAKAQFYLGLMYQAGLGVERDFPKAIKLYEKAADKNETGAKFYLGNCYRFGVGVPRNFKKSGQYYINALNSALRSAKSGSDGLMDFWLGKKGRPTLLSRTILEDEWIASAAREYGIGLWEKADSEQGMEAARTLVGKSAQNGDVLAKDVLVKMNIKDRQSYLKDAGLKRPEISENKADAHADAIRPVRATAFLPVYLQEDVKTLYAKTDAERNITDVQTYNKRRTNVAGEGLWELWVKIRKPDVRNAADFKGIVFICVEFTDRKSGQKYAGLSRWGAGRPYDSELGKTGEAIGSMYMNMNAYPDAQLTGWALVYGHLLKDGTVIGVFDSKSKNRRTFNDLCRDNANSKWLPTIMESAIDLGDDRDTNEKTDGATGEEE